MYKRKEMKKIKQGVVIGAPNFEEFVQISIIGAILCLQQSNKSDLLTTVPDKIHELRMKLNMLVQYIV